MSYQNKNIQWMAIILSLISITVVRAAINITEVNELKNSLLSNLPDGVTLPPEFNDIDLKQSAKQAEDIFKEKCSVNSGSDAAFEQASQAATTLMECIQEIIDINTIQEEIEEAKPNGNLDTVFNKYCNKRSEGVKCVDTFTTSIDPCLTQEEKNQRVVIINITKSLLEFVCHENGNQIALFIAEEGPECFESKKDYLIECFNQTMGKYANYDMPTLENLPTLVIKEENCIDMNKLEECVVEKLEQCKETTPANLVEALFRFVRKETPCDKKKIKANSSGFAKLSNVLIGSWIMAIFAKLIVSYQ